MKLKDTKLTVVAPAATKASATAPVSVRIPGSDAKQFVELNAQIKSLETAKATFEADLKATGVRAILAHNCSKPEPISSVKLLDDENGLVTVTLKNAYAATTAGVVDELCEALELDPNIYFQSVVKYNFNQKIFYRADGSFNEKVYRAIRKAVGSTVVDLIDAGELAAGVEPFSEDKVVVARDSFHTARWAMDEAANTLIHQRVPAQVAIKVG